MQPPCWSGPADHTQPPITCACAEPQLSPWQHSSTCASAYLCEVTCETNFCNPISCLGIKPCAFFFLVSPQVSPAAETWTRLHFTSISRRKPTYELHRVASWLRSSSKCRRQECNFRGRTFLVCVHFCRQLTAALGQVTPPVRRAVASTGCFQGGAELLQWAAGARWE